MIVALSLQSASQPGALGQVQRHCRTRLAQPPLEIAVQPRDPVGVRPNLSNHLDPHGVDTQHGVRVLFPTRGTPPPPPGAQARSTPKPRAAGSSAAKRVYLAEHRATLANP